MDLNNLDYTVLIGLITANFVISFIGFIQPLFFDKYLFSVGKIRYQKQYWRLISSGFLHIGWGHLIMNMLVLYIFAEPLILSLGLLNFIVIYFISEIIGNLVSLFFHRNHYDYTAVGASGAVSGIVFACIVLSPQSEIASLFIPIGIPGWIYALIYLLGSIYAIKKNIDNIGHEAHLGGGLAGILMTFIIAPSICFQNYILNIVILIPYILLTYIVLYKPLWLGMMPVKLVKQRTTNNLTLDEKFNLKKQTEQKEIDAILDKISEKGIDSLTSKEKNILDSFSKK